MTISVISVSNLLNKFITSTLSLAAVCQASVALASTPLTADLWAPLGVTAILLGGGRGHVTDFSAADNNPAGIALQKTYTVSGELGWSGQKARQAEAAACDSATSELAACIKFRQTQSITGAKDRRYTVGFAESLQQMGGMILGVGGITYSLRKNAPLELFLRRARALVRGFALDSSILSPKGFSLGQTAMACTTPPEQKPPMGLV